LRDDVLLLVLGEVLHEKIIGALHLRVAVDLLQNAFAHPLLPVEFTHFVQDDGALQALAGHGLDVSPILGVVLDVGINLRIHFRVRAERGLIGGGGIAAGARWR
jgi:hypothetical protein